MARGLAQRGWYIRLLLAAGLVWAWGATPARAADGDPFSIVVVPDPQGYADHGIFNAFPNRFNDHIQWIADNRDALNIAFVTSMGDTVQNFNAANTDEWNKALAAMNRLHAGNNPALIPYSVCIGNHDFDQKQWLGTPLGIDANICVGASRWLSTFGPGRYQGESWFVGSDAGFVYQNPRWGAQTGVGLNSYQMFQGGGRTFLHLNLELGAPDAALAWAETVMAAHPGTPTIVSTHGFVGGDGTKLDIDRMWRRYLDRTYTAGGNTGQEIWDKFISQHREVFLVLSGHTGLDYSGVEKNVFGDDVYIQMVCYTAKRLATDGDGSSAYRNGAGWLRVLGFDPATESIHVRSYSTVLNEWAGNEGGDPAYTWLTDCYDDAGNLVKAEHLADFTIEFDWDERFSVPAPAGGGPAGGRRGGASATTEGAGVRKNCLQGSPGKTPVFGAESGLAKTGMSGIIVVEPDALPRRRARADGGVHPIWGTEEDRRCERGSQQF
ncbi:MAG TPA: metallophosphoesterase [Phycisphaerae bacterium]|nr:metallophosphoesterase [Phycisphaerae bacterium]